MQETDVKEQEQDWIAKYRAALDAVSKKEPCAPGLSALVQVVRTHLELVFRSASDKLRAASQSGKQEVAIRTKGPTGNGQTEERLVDIRRPCM
jgi:hypothetical protein